MAYRIAIATGASEERRRVAAFLAGFVRDGELAHPKPGDDEAAVWERRMGWWWDDNPHCRGDSPRGFLLEHEEAGLVGFSGYIPFDYECDGETVPSLVATTLFVREMHRGAVMGLLAKQRSLAKTYQIVDGSPSPEMRRLLEKFGYRQAGARARYLVPRWAPARVLGRALDWGFPLPSSAEAADCLLVGDPAEWDGFHEPHDGRIHRHGGRVTAEWLLRAGSEPRSFHGLIAADGNPLACALGVHKRRFGWNVCLLLDHRDHHPGGAGLGLLVRKLLDEPAALPAGTAGIVLSRFDAPALHGAAGHRAASNLYFHLPPPWQDRPKACLPIEGDLVLL